MQPTLRQSSFPIYYDEIFLYLKDMIFVNWLTISKIISGNRMYDKRRWNKMSYPFQLGIFGWKMNSRKVHQILKIINTDGYHFESIFIRLYWINNVCPSSSIIIKDLRPLCSPGLNLDFHNSAVVIDHCDKRNLRSTIWC